MRRRLSCAAAILLAAASLEAASDCPGEIVTALPYSDAGTFPTAVDDLDPVGLDFSSCGFADPVAQNGNDFVVSIPVGEQRASIECTLAATGSVLLVYGLGEACNHPGGVTAWAEQSCVLVDAGATIEWTMEFFGAASFVVDALDSAFAEFSLECDGTLPVSLTEISVE
jgi:hypothetical protein